MTEINKRGKLLVLEGGPGSGKTSYAYELKKLTSNGSWYFTREPGGTAYGESVRDAVQGFHDYPVSPTAALLGYNSTRANLIDLVVRPKLNEGINVVLDRYWFSSFAYQGAEGASKLKILLVSMIATGGLMPDLTMFFRVDPKIGQQRKHGKDDVDRYDVKNQEYFANVMQNYDTLGLILRPRWEIVDASKSLEDVFSQATGILKRRKFIQ